MKSAADQTSIPIGDDRMGMRDHYAPVWNDVYTVLVVQFDPPNRKLLVKMLTALGYRAIEAADGIEALDRIHRQPAPDLMILAVDLPRMNGIDTVSAVRNLSSPKRNLPVVAISLDVPQDQIAQLNEIGVDKFLSRPFDMHELAEVVSSLLKGHLEEVPATALRSYFGVRS